MACVQAGLRNPCEMKMPLIFNLKWMKMGRACIFLLMDIVRIWVELLPMIILESTLLSEVLVLLMYRLKVFLKMIFCLSTVGILTNSMEPLMRSILKKNLFRKEFLLLP